MRKVKTQTNHEQQYPYSVSHSVDDEFLGSAVIIPWQSAEGGHEVTVLPGFFWLNNKLGVLAQPLLRADSFFFESTVVPFRLNFLYSKLESQPQEVLRPKR